MYWSLLVNKYVLSGIAVIALFFFAVHWKHGYDNDRREEGARPLREAIAKQKQEAAAQLSAKVKENAAKEEADRQRAITNQRDYDESLKTYDARNKSLSDKLRFTTERSRLCGSSPREERSTSPRTAKDVPVESGVSDAVGTVVVEVPAGIAAGAKALMMEADKLAIWGESCHAFVNK